MPCQSGRNGCETVQDLAKNQAVDETEHEDMKESIVKLETSDSKQWDLIRGLDKKLSILLGQIAVTVAAITLVVDLVVNFLLKR